MASRAAKSAYTPIVGGGGGVIGSASRCGDRDAQCTLRLATHVCFITAPAGDSWLRVQFHSAVASSIQSQMSPCPLPDLACNPLVAHGKWKEVWAARRQRQWVQRAWLMQTCLGHLRTSRQHCSRRTCGGAIICLGRQHAACLFVVEAGISVRVGGAYNRRNAIRRKYLRYDCESPHAPESCLGMRWFRRRAAVRKHTCPQGFN